MAQTDEGGGVWHLRVLDPDAAETLRHRPTEAASCRNRSTQPEPSLEPAMT